MRRLAVALVVMWSVPLVARQTAPRDVTKDAQAFVELMHQQEFAKVQALFTEPMKAALPEEKLRTTWATLLMQAGAFKSQRSARVEEVGNMKRVTVTVDFERTPLDLVVAYNPAGLIGGFNVRPSTPPAPPWSAPSYVDASTFTESEVTVGAKDWPLPGSLTMPSGSGPFPALVLVHGSGPNDRDESYGPNKTFKDLAYGLSSRGIAVLRYEKRSKVFGARLTSIPNFTVKDETIDDALAAVAFLRAQTKIDGARIVVLGHSLGGMLIPRVGSADAKLAGLIVMAGAAGDLAPTMVRQVRYLAEADGRVTADEQKQIDAMEALGKTVAALTPADAGKPGLIQGAPASYWLDLRTVDPPAMAKALTQPLLVMQGARDYQVTMADDFALWQAALNGKTGVTFHTYPALNHLFLPGEGKSLPAEYDTPGHVPAEVISDIATWIASLK